MKNVLPNPNSMFFLNGCRTNGEQKFSGNVLERYETDLNRMCCNRYRTVIGGADSLILDSVLQNFVTKCLNILQTTYR